MPLPDVNCAVESRKEKNRLALVERLVLDDEAIVGRKYMTAPVEAITAESRCLQC